MKNKEDKKIKRQGLEPLPHRFILHQELKIKK